MSRCLLNPDPIPSSLPLKTFLNFASIGKKNFQLPRRNKSCTPMNYYSMPYNGRRDSPPGGMEHTCKHNNEGYHSCSASSVLSTGTDILHSWSVAFQPLIQTV